MLVRRVRQALSTGQSGGHVCWQIFCREPLDMHSETQRLCGPPWAAPGASWVCFGRSWRLLDAPGGLLSDLGGVWGASWAQLEPSKRHLERFGSLLGRVLGALGPAWEASWALLELSGRCLGRSWSRLGGVLGALGCVLPTC